MQYCRLGRTGLRVSVIGLGGMPLLKMPVPEAHILVAGACAHGINFFETSATYGESEVRIGSALNGQRDQTVIATKSAPLSARDARSDVLRACQRLRTECLDLFLIEGVNRAARLETVLAPNGVLEGLLAQRDAGRVRHIGLSGHDCDLLADALVRGPDFEVVEFPFNVLEDDPSVRLLLRTAAERDVGTIAMKPLAGGLLPEPALALRWLVNQPIHTAAVGMVNADEVTANAAIGDQPTPLTAAEEARLRALVAPLAEQFCRRCMLCEPCPQGIGIYQILELGQKVRLPHMAPLMREIYDAIEPKADACAVCGECHDRCPYHLPIVEMIREAHKYLTG